MAVKGTREREAEGFPASFTPEDIWYTRKDDTIFAIALTSPNNRQARLTSLGSGQETAPGTIRSVRLLGSEAPITWDRRTDALHVSLPDQMPGDRGYALAIDVESLAKANPRAMASLVLHGEVSARLIHSIRPPTPFFSPTPFHSPLPFHFLTPCTTPHSTHQQ